MRICRVKKSGLLNLNYDANRDNECFAQGHGQFMYTAVVQAEDIFDGNEFIVDHNEIQRWLSEQCRAGSCETICREGVNILIRECRKAGIHPIHVSLELTPIHTTEKPSNIVQMDWWDDNSKVAGLLHG